MRSLETPETLTTYSYLLAQWAGSCESRVFGQFVFRVRASGPQTLCASCGFAFVNDSAEQFADDQPC